MATLNLGSITINDAIVAKILTAFDQTTPAQLQAVARLLVRRYLREEAMRRYLAKLEADSEAALVAQQAQEKADLEAGWPSP